MSAGVLAAIGLGAVVLIVIIIAAMSGGGGEQGGRRTQLPKKPRERLPAADASRPTEDKVGHEPAQPASEKTAADAPGEAEREDEGTRADDAAGIATQREAPSWDLPGTEESGEARADAERTEARETVPPVSSPPSAAEAIDVAAFLARFDSLMSKGDHAGARKYAEAAKPGNSAHADILDAAARVAEALETRPGAVRRGAQSLVGEEAELRIRTGTVSCEIKSVADDGLVVATVYYVNRERRSRTAPFSWDALHPDQLDLLADKGGWKAQRVDRAVARAYVAFASGDLEAALASLPKSVVGGHPLARHLAEYLEKRAAAAKIEAAYSAAMDDARARMGRKKWKGAAEALKEALRAKPEDGEAKKLLAEAKLRISSVAGDILSLTGNARTKFVWMRQTPDTIMLFDTNVGSEQVVTQGPFGWPQVFITPTGTRIIFMKNTTSLYVVDTSGANERELCAAKSALGVAEDPPGTEWAYYGDAYHDVNPYGRLWRVQIDNTSVKQLMWDKTNICWQWAFTRDGKTAAAALPWPGCHIANLPNVSYYQVHDSGCMVGLAPSATRMLHATSLQFGGEHRGISVHVIPGGSDTEINLGTAPGCWEKTMQHPNWAMYDDRFFVVSGPWTGDTGTTNVLFGQFNAAFNGIASWVQVTQAPAGKQDIYPKCWIQSGPDVKDSPKMDAIKKKAAESKKTVRKKPVVKKGKGWPVSRKDLIFLWENRKGAFLAYDREGNASPSLFLMPRDLARFDHNQGLWLEAGSFPVPGVEKFLGAQKIATLTIEAYLTPEKGSCPSMAEIISYSAKSDDANLVLGQLGNRLVMTMKGGAKPSGLCTLTAGEPVHVIVTYAPGKLTCYKNGKLAAINASFRGSPSNWTEQHLVFGNNWDGKRPWAGHLEGIAIYTRALGPKEAEREHAAFAEKLKGRKPVPRIEIQAKLLAKTKAPKFEEIAPYTQATAVYEYEVEKVVSGPCKEKNIRVVHHTLIDRKMLPVSQWEIGKSYTLELEPRDANPQLDDGIDVPRDDLPIDLDVVLYYDVGPLRKTP